MRLKEESNLKMKNNKRAYIISKRIFDIIGGILGIILLSPVLLVVAIAIKVNDPSGNILYSQIRVGQNGKRFRMYKFRSMVNNADKKLQELLAKNEVQGNMFKIKDDPRITSVGVVIRKYSLDELPQLWNVINGSMSLVGPRPPLIREVENYTQYDMQRLSVKPGCTGLWQVSGRNDVGFDDMVKLDIEYINKRSFLFDLWIILKTIGVFIHPNGAY